MEASHCVINTVSHIISEVGYGYSKPTFECDKSVLYNHSGKMYCDNMFHQRNTDINTVPIVPIPNESNQYSQTSIQLTF